MIPRFARVLTEMIARGWIDLWWGLPWPQGSTVPADQTAAVLNDSASWIDRPDGDWRIIGMTTTDRWDHLATQRAGRPRRHVDSGAIQVTRHQSNP
jgi:hypothetical protein